MSDRFPHTDGAEDYPFGDESGPPKPMPWDRIRLSPGGGSVPRSARMRATKWILEERRAWAAQKTPHPSKPRKLRGREPTR